MDQLTGTLLFDVTQGAAEFRRIDITDAPFGGDARKIDLEAQAAGVKDPRLVKEVRPN